MTDTIDGFLEHYGVKGMKWGKRKGSSGPRRPSSEDHVTSRALKAKRNRELSTKELKALNDRLQAETQRKKLDPNKIQKGQNIAKGILAAGTTISSLYALSQTPLGKQVTEALKSSLAKA